MRNVGSSSSVRRRTNTGLVAVQTAFDTKHHAAASKAAKDSSKIKGFTEDIANNSRQQVDMHNCQDKSNRNIDNAHQRHQRRSSLDNALAAAQQAVANEHSLHSTDNPRSSLRIIEAQGCKRRLQVVGAQHIKATAIGNNQRNSKGNCQRTTAQRSLNVVSRAAVAAMRTTFFVNLRQRALDKSGSTADNSDNPHPEHSAIAA